MDKDLRKLVKALEKSGYTIRLTRRGHVVVELHGRWIATFAGSPSDWRGWRNGLAKLAASGFRWPPRK